MSNAATLYIVATPIGNLSDMTLRAIEILKSVAIIYAEDTRHSQPLLQHYNIHTPLQSCHAHNESARIEKILLHLQAGKDVALISDAGTPLISDPGYALVRACHAAGVNVSPIPGTCAAIAALSASGLPTDTFIFAGFLPQKSEARSKCLAQYREMNKTVIFYESPHRILETLEAMLEQFGPERRLAFARELTKQFETVKVATLAEMLDFVRSSSHQQKGEIVLVLDKALNESKVDEQAMHCLKILCAELPIKQACKIASQLTGLKKNILYKLALTLTL